MCCKSLRARLLAAKRRLEQRRCPQVSEPTALRQSAVGAARTPVNRGESLNPASASSIDEMGMGQVWGSAEELGSSLLCSPLGNVSGRTTSLSRGSVTNSAGLQLVFPLYVYATLRKKKKKQP